ncbi:MGH1-like glycoside hydrolase domain-containing protein [Niabella soli]|uniref:Glucosidase n=1 Tax=Niabella soli DSM 19437 TaxID=929713 RepID=W0F258_9BACT|nr:glucosidase [Niabella soli]AHF15411.1 glucosidase [Niabella soli DSM 19437]
MNEKERLRDVNWRAWGPYVSNREWGNVREDYSANGDAWNYTTHDMARSKTYRWGEEAIGGICDAKQLLCFAPAFWNKKDPIVKEIFFGLSNSEGNHGEDVKELFYYLDGTPSHSYMKMLYKYPQQAFPYNQLLQENKRRGKMDPEFELIDTGIFDSKEYFDIFIEYAKADVNDLFIKITLHNRGLQPAPIVVLPTIWFRNTWAWGYDDYKPVLQQESDQQIAIDHKDLLVKKLYSRVKGALLFCDNETNNQRLYQSANEHAYCKDGINDFITGKNKQATNPANSGTKAAFQQDLMVDAGGSLTLYYRLTDKTTNDPFADVDHLFATRISEANDFYATVQVGLKTDDARLVHRQALAGLLWNKQFYHYNVYKWLNGDPAQVKPPESRKSLRNGEWKTLDNSEVISMPDKWEYPWYASWDLAFQCVSFSLIDSAFAKEQLKLLTKEWYMHPCGKLPAYEWNFSSVNPPVHAWAAFRVFKIDEKLNGIPDLPFLETVFQKLLLTFSWWVNQKDANDNNIFEGGFLGLDNIGIFDRNATLPNGAVLEQADGTSWMAMYALNMMRIALELALYNPVYESMASKFFEHFLAIAYAINSASEDGLGLWDEEDQFYYDMLQFPNGTSSSLRLRSAVGLIPLFAVEVIDQDILNKLPTFSKHLEWVLSHKPELANLVSRWNEPGKGNTSLLSLLRGHRLKKIIERMADPNEFLGEFGVRALSKVYQQNPYVLNAAGLEFVVRYTPADSDSDLFGGNSNWRGPIWMPLNFLIIESLQRFHFYFGDDFKIHYPTGSDQRLTLDEIAADLTQRLCSIFLKNEKGRRAVNGDNQKAQTDPDFKDSILFYEYFDGDNGRGLGASHQTGWTSIIAKLLQPRLRH